MKKLTAPVRIMQMIARLSPEYFMYFLPEVAVASALPLLTVCAPKLIIEVLTTGGGYGQILTIILWYGAGLLFLNLASGFLGKKSGYAAEKFSVTLSREVGEAVMRLALCELETTAERDNIRLAGNARETIALCGVIKRLITSLMTLAGYVFILSKLDIRFVLIVAALFAVKSAFTALQFYGYTRMRRLHAENDRVGNYLTSLCYFNQGAAKEIRVNSLQGWFLGKVRGFRHRMVSIQFKEFRMRFLLQCIDTVLFACSMCYILLSLAANYRNGRITLADFTLYFSTVTAVIALLGTIVELISDYNRQLCQAADFERLVKLSKKDRGEKEECKEREKCGDSGENGGCSLMAAPVGDEVEIEFKNVSFTYPGSKTPALNNVSIKIENREKLVIVGYNGAGKSTFIKLLCKFYHPSEGIITLNGIDIWQIPNEQYYRRIGAVFQDYAAFAFTIKENITAGIAGDIFPALKEAGMDAFVRGLKNGEDTYISKKYSGDGVELSGGQEQKIALARAIYKNTPLLLLDEPTASFDAKAEAELYAQFFRIAAEKTVIFISHRLAASKAADRIAVFADGAVAEYGTHDGLMERGGIYAEMFERQREGYISFLKLKSL